MRAPPTDRTYRCWLAACVVVGLALRIAAAQGALWLDEAWSAKQAVAVGTPLGVFLRINHDNNHHLNSLWLQLVGLDAAPLLQRALSIATGSAAIWLAAVVARPRGMTTALVTAWLFAVAPILVTLGAEARGYAPMTLALLGATLAVDRLLAGEPLPRWRSLLAWCFFFGALSQLTMVFGVCALVGWFGFATWRARGFAAAVRASLHLFWPALLALAFALALIFVPAWLAPTGFQFGRYEPFGIYRFLHGLIEALDYTVAWPLNSFWTVAATVAFLILARPLVAPRRLPFYWLAIVGFPAALALLHAGNVEHPRYYLVACVVLLLLLGEAIGGAFARGGRARTVAAIGLGALSVPAIALDLDVARNRRGDVDPAIATLRRLAPTGTTVILDRPASDATLELAAAHAHYPLRFQRTACPPREFVFTDRAKGETFPARLDYCGIRYRPLIGREARGLSGLHWTLYRRAR